MAEQHTWNNGFTLVEMCLVMFCVSMLSLAIGPTFRKEDSDEIGWSDYYLYKQSQAMRTGQHITMDDGIVFNERGNVNRAKTVQKENQTIVIELGGGRLVFP